MKPAMWWALTGVSALQAGLQIASGANPVFFKVAAGSIFCFWLLWSAFVRTYRRPLVTAASFAVTVDGLRGTFDGREMTLPWSDIERVNAIDTYIQLTPRRKLAPIAMPQAAIDDRERLWTYLEAQLIAKRGLILTPGLRTSIYNSAS